LKREREIKKRKKPMPYQETKEKNVNPSMRSAKESNWDLPKRFKITTLNPKLSPIV
jgi:hypothetical protein